MCARRAIGRILSLGFSLPGPNVDNYSFITAPAFFDYDAIVVDPRALADAVRAVVEGADAQTFSGRRVRNVPEGPDDVALGELLLRRRDEAVAAFDRGAVIVVFTHPAVALEGVALTSTLDCYFWLPLPEGVTLTPSQLVPGDGTRIAVADHAHPLAGFVSSQLANISYRAHFDTKRIPRFDEGGRIFVRSVGGAAVGVELPAERGRMIFLPALARIPGGDARYVMSDTLQAGIRRALDAEAEGRPPSWLQRHPLPGIAERAARVAAARAALKTSASELGSAEAEHDELARFQRMLWQEGHAGLDAIVLDALALIGFDVRSHDRAALELRMEGGRVLLEIEASEHDVDVAPHHRLRQRIEQAIERHGTAPRGLIIVNGKRLRDPDERGTQVTDGLRVAAETMRYAVATTYSLYQAVAAKLAGDDDAVAAYRRRLVTEDGVLT